VGRDVRAALQDVPEQRRALVTCEGAFSYLARDLGLREAYLWPVNAEQEGTPRQIADAVEFVRERRVPAVFCESTVSPEAQRQVARESGSRFAGQLYVDSLSAADGPVPTYLELLRRDARTIAAGLTGTTSR
jgi:manganese transport system substrate-binding protein